jgi:hypothetical protein
MDSLTKLNTSKLQHLGKEVESVYRDIGNIENSKLDRQLGIRQHADQTAAHNKLYTEISMKEN